MSIIKRQDISKIVKLLKEIQEDGSFDGFAAILIGYAPRANAK